MDRTDLELFERSLRHATANHSGPALDAALAEIGWRDALAVDAQSSVSLLFEAQGHANATSGALDELLLHALGLPPGDAPTGVVLPPPGRCTAPGSLDDGGVLIAGLATEALVRRGTAVVAATVGGEEVAAVVPLAGLAVRPVEGLDPALGLAEVSGTGGDGAAATVCWADAVALGQLAVGHELVGASRRMLELAREHALERIQFGRPIATFQAVRHRLAETLVAIEAAQAVLDAAWLDGSRETAAMAKALAGHGARTAARHCQQVLAGIGFTTEHPLHRYVRRVLVLDSLFGAARSLTVELGRGVLEGRTLPEPLAL